MERNDPASQDPASRLASLRMEHRDLDVAIDALRSMAAPDQLQLGMGNTFRPEYLAVLEDMVVPDIIA